MGKFMTRISFDNYSEEAIPSVVKGLIGSPVCKGDLTDEELVVGTVVSAKRIEGTKIIELECEVMKGAR